MFINCKILEEVSQKSSCIRSIIGHRPLICASAQAPLAGTNIIALVVQSHWTESVLLGTFSQPFACSLSIYLMRPAENICKFELDISRCKCLKKQNPGANGTNLLT